MNIDKMRSLFREHTADLESSVEDPEVDEYLNRTYQYTIPAEVGGELGETVWNLETTIGTETYPYADSIIAPSGRPPWIESYVESSVDIPVSQRFLDVETGPSVFEYSDRYGESVTGFPNSALFFGRQVTLTPAPDKAYTVKIPARGGPAALTNDGIANDAHGMAVITGAAKEFLGRTGDIEGFSVQAALYDQYKSVLQVHAQARPNHRRWRRSF